MRLTRRSATYARTRAGGISATATPSVRLARVGLRAAPITAITAPTTTGQCLVSSAGLVASTRCVECRYRSDACPYADQPAEVSDQREEDRERRFPPAAEEHLAVAVALRTGIGSAPIGGRSARRSRTQARLRSEPSRGHSSASGSGLEDAWARFARCLRLDASPSGLRSGHCLPWLLRPCRRVESRPLASSMQRSRRRGRSRIFSMCFLSRPPHPRRRSASASG